jgi:hypothetical protein
MQACAALTTQVRSQRQSQSYFMTNGQSACLSRCQVASGDQDQIFVTLRQLRVCLCWVPSLTRGRVCLLQLLLTLVNAVISTTVSISCTCHLYLQFYMSAFYIASCQESGSLWTPTIYSFTCNMYNI